MNQRAYSFALFAFVLFAKALPAQTNWIGTVSPDWGVPANWSNGLPGPFNEPTIPASPAGAFSPTIGVFTYFNFNVQNFGHITVAGDGGVTIFGTFVNHAGGTLVLSNSPNNFLVEGSGVFENHGEVNSDGTFNNIGTFTNSTNGIFNNHHIFSHSASSFLNQGEFNNFGQFFSEAEFQNAGEMNNQGLFNNNDITMNKGVFNIPLGALLRNDQQLVNQSGGLLNISGTFLNNNVFQNLGQLQTNPSSVTTNGLFIRNSIGGSWNNQGIINNVLCAIYENKGAHINMGMLDNEGIIYADNPIAPQLPMNTGSSVYITPSNSSTLCHNFTAGLASNNAALVLASNLTNDQLELCSGWSALVNGQPSVTYTGCSSLGNHNVTVTITDPFGRVTTCPAVIAVVDNLAPIIACQPTQVVPLPAGQCTASVSLLPPTVMIENCAVANILNNAPAQFPIGQTVVTWAVQDQNLNTSTCAQTVVVQDPVYPAITCPPNLTLNATMGICGVSNQDPMISGNPATATDNCGVPILTVNAPSILPIGTNIVTWLATDAYGNVSNCQQVVTVTDNQPPIITLCPPDLTVQPQSVGCQLTVNWANALAQDNCGLDNIFYSIPSGSIFDLGITTITVTASDVNGNTANCQFKITVQDAQAPVWENCPASSTITLFDCGDVAVGNWVPPTVSDPCLDAVSYNMVPGDALQLGTNEVVYTATDLSGNTSTCQFTIDVVAQMALDCPVDILVNVGVNETSSNVSWNPPPGATQCAVCASTSIQGFYYMGEKSGHRYYTYLGGQVTWQEALALATQQGGYLATVADFTENELLRKEFPATFNAAWIGLSDEASEGQFAWSNGEASTFTNWTNGIAPANDQLDFGVLGNNGLWLDDSASAVHSFILEIPCYQIDLTASDPSALVTLNFPLGSTTISYETTDGCGNTCSCSFDVQVVQNQQITPCVATGNSTFGWIESVLTDGFGNSSGDNAGYGDYTNIVYELPDPGCILKLVPGGPAVDHHLYWRVWADLNGDGDFYDSDETLASVEGVGEQVLCYDLPVTLPTGPTALRIAMSRWSYAAPCGGFLAGEVEDYLIEFVDSSQFNPSDCVWSFGQINGSTEDLKVKLNWLGTGNCDVAFFVVERSADGQVYEIAGEVPAVNNGQLPTLYEFEDKTPFYGHNHYKVWAVLDDSSKVASNVFETDFNVDLEAIFVYPNPASTELIFHVFPFNGLPAQVFIANVNGQIVFDRYFEVLDNEPIRFDLLNYSSGVYNIYLRPDGRREQVQRFVVARH